MSAIDHDHFDALNLIDGFDLDVRIASDHEVTTFRCLGNDRSP